MKILLEEMSWPEVKEAVEADSTVIIPVGQIEEHGPHLPLNTDSTIVTEIAKRAAQRASGKIRAVVMPTIDIGYSQADVMKFPGTLTLKPETFVAVVIEVCECLIQHGFKKIVILNGHGHNPAPLEVAVRHIRDDTGVAVALIPMYWSLAAEELSKIRKSKLGGIYHACELETSLQLLIQPHLVDMSKAKKETLKIPSEFLARDGLLSGKVFLSSWALTRTTHGILGDPTVASKESGKKFMGAIVKRLADFLIDFSKGKISKMLKETKSKDV